MNASKTILACLFLMCVWSLNANAKTILKCEEGSIPIEDLGPNTNITYEIAQTRVYGAIAEKISSSMSDWVKHDAVLGLFMYEDSSSNLSKEKYMEYRGTTYWLSHQIYCARSSNKIACAETCRVGVVPDSTWD